MRNSIFCFLLLALILVFCMITAGLKCSVHDEAPISIDAETVGLDGESSESILFTYSQVSGDYTDVDQEEAEVDKEAEKERSIDFATVVAVGDIMLGTLYPANPNYLPADCRILLAPVIDYLKDGDLAFGNLEGVFSDSVKYVRSCIDPEKCYRFIMPERFVNCLIEAGFDLLSIANNHIYDSSEWGKNNTIRVLKEAGLHFAGTTDYPMTTFEINGVTYGFAAFAPNSGTNRITDYDRLKEIVEELKNKSQIVIVSFHGGGEGADYEHLNFDYEFFLGENRGNVQKFSRLAIDAGADLVLGHGPHVSRAMELYNGKLIAYSLGNFCTYQRFNLQGVRGIAPILKIWLDERGDFVKGHITPIYQEKSSGAKLDPEGRIIARLQYLLESDFPEGLIEIDDEGWVLKKKGRPAGESTD